MDGKASNQPGRYDRAGVAQLASLREALTQTGLPPLRLRKLTGILNALEMQIEDGGDSPEVNRLLLDALLANILHQLDESAAQPVLRALADCAAAEARRWGRVPASVPPPVEQSDAQSRG